MRLLEGMNSTSFSPEELMVFMAEDGMSAKEISGYLPSPYDKTHRVGAYLRQENIARLSSIVSGQFEIEDNGLARCATCSKRALLDSFPIREVNESRLYYKATCYTCLELSSNPLDRNSLPRRIRTKEGLLRNRAHSTTAQLPYGYLGFLYAKQKGHCFYTNRVMSVTNSLPKEDSMSVDRIIYDNPYEQGNVVLVINKANMVKRDMTLAEMRKWTPSWSEKLDAYYENLNDFLWTEI